MAVSGSPSSGTIYQPINNERVKTPGKYAHSVPLLAYKTASKGRIIYLGIVAHYLDSPVATTTLESIVLERGMKGVPSDGFKLFTNSLRWLAEPTLADGSMGGAEQQQSILQNPYKIKFDKPYVWDEHVAFPAQDTHYPGIVGARTRYSSGKASADEWVAAAQAKGLAFVVFLEEFSRLSAEDFNKLKADCARLSTPEFAALPGFTIDDEIGNHYFYCGPSFGYPEKKHLTADGKAFTSYVPALPLGDPKAKGQLAMTTLDYAYSISNFNLTAGNYLFSHSAAPFADWFSDWDVMGVVTTRNGAVLEDATDDFLKLVRSGQGPTPLAVTLMDDPAQLDADPWRTVLCLPENGGALGIGHISKERKIRDYFNLWHFYPNNPSSNYISDGPQIDYWGYCGPRDYEGNSPGDFVWQNYRWKLQGRVSSTVGLKEICVYDGPALFRRYLPHGEKSFTFTLDLVHDRQHTLALVVTDVRGGKAVSGEHWDRNHRLEEFMCADRNNQLSYGLVPKKDGTGILLGGNQMLATPCKRLGNNISPSGTFKNDALLGAPAFDGGASGEPFVYEQIRPISPDKPLPVPDVVETARLLVTRDVNIGEGVSEHTFTDNIDVQNVWYTLWKTAPATGYHTRRRNTFFQIDAESPLAVFLWQMDITLLEPVRNKGFEVISLAPEESKLWLLHGSDQTTYAGTWEEMPRSSGRSLTVPFSRNAYAFCADSPLGSAAIYPLTDGLQATLNLPHKNALSLYLPEGEAPQHPGETRHVEVLLVGVPRLTEYTAGMPASTTEVAERFYHDFGLDGGSTGYTLQAQAGTVTGRRYILNVDGGQDGAFSGIIRGHLISSLPIAVSGLHDRWTAYLYDRGLRLARPVGMVEGKAWATVPLAGADDLFLGHPVTGRQSGRLPAGHPVRRACLEHRGA